MQLSIWLPAWLQITVQGIEFMLSYRMIWNMKASMLILKQNTIRGVFSKLGKYTSVNKDKIELPLQIINMSA